MATKTFQNVKLNVTFTTAAERANIKSGDNIADSFGKIAKWYEDFHSVVWDGNAAKVNGKSVTIDVAPTADDAGKFLKADGTWAAPADTTYTFAEGTTNGAFDVTTGGKTTSVPVHGLGSAAFVESETFATAKHTHAIDDVTGLQTALDGKIASTEKGAANGVVPLNAETQIDSKYLPSYVDDVIEGYLSEGKFYEDAEHAKEITGETGKIYVDLATNGSYRYSGTQYVNISNPLDADRGLSLTSGKIGHSNAAVTAVADATALKIAYDTYGHITASAALTKADVGLGDVENKSSETIRGEITLKNVTDALGYTPAKQDEATTTTAGLMSADDKKKLDDIAAGAEVNQNAFSNVKVGDVTVAADAKTDTFEVTGATGITVSADAATKKITITGTTYEVFTGATAATAGTSGLVKAPAAGDQGKFLAGDGTWKSIAEYSLKPATTTTLGGVIVGDNLSVTENGTLTAKTMTGATADVAGTAGYVVAPAAGDQVKFLMGDGTWSDKPVVEEDELILNCIAG